MAAVKTVKSKPQDWCFVSGIISVAEVDLLKQAFFLDIMRCHDAESVFNLISKTRYRNIITSPEDVNLLSIKTEEFFAKELASIRPYVPDELIIDFFLFPEEVKKLRQTLLDLQPNQKHKTLNIIEEFCAQMPGYFWNNYSNICLPYLQKASEGLMSRREFSLFLDSITLGIMFSGWAQALPQGTISDAVKEYTSYRLVSLVARALESGITYNHIVNTMLTEPISKSFPENWEDMLCAPGGKLGIPLLHIFGIESHEEDIRNPEILERIADDKASEILLKAKYTAFGPEKAFNYLWAIWIQNKNLRLSAGVVLGKLPAEQVQEKLRREFV
ncbi:MAG: hypothetical protein ABIH42_06330 [Planctomycetota bacterium]